MQVIYKIAEKQRKSRAGFLQLMDYISRDSFKTFGVGVSDDKDIASKQYLINKDLYDKNRDGKDRFTYHVMASFGADVPVEKVIEIMLNFCEENFYNKGFDSFFAVHTDTNNIHCHVIADNVNFNTGNMIHSVTQKQYDSMSQKKKDKAETFVYEKQRELFEDICIRHGLDISYEERYEYMHEQKVKEGRKWLTKEQYRAKKDKDSWSNEIKNKLEEIYKNEDVNEDNIKDIANKYGLEVTRHNKDKKYITFALIDEQGKRTNQKLKLVQELNKKKKKSQKELTEDNVKLAVKLDTLEVQEKELKKDSSENVFNYDNFFGGKKKEEKTREETREDIYAFFEKEKEKLRIRKEKEAEAKAKEDIRPVEEVKEDIRPVEEVKEDIKPVEEVKEDIRPVEEVKEDIKPVEEVKEDIKTPVNTYIVEDSKPSDFELEKEYKTEKDILDNFYKTQEENKKEQDSKAKALEEEVKNIEKAEIDKITKSDEVLRRLNVEEEERQQEAKAKKEQEEKAKKEQETDLKTTDEIIKTGEEKEIAVAEVESKQEITDSDFTDIDSKSTITESKQEKQEEEKQDLESKQVDLDSLMSKIDSYKLVDEYDLFDTLPPFQVITDDVLFNSETGEGNLELAKSLIENQKGEEYWHNMNPKDITKWVGIEVFTVGYIDNNDNFKEYNGYEDYSKSTIKQFLKENTTIAEELAKEYMPNNSKKKEQDSKDYEVEKKKDREIDFN